MKFLSKNFRNGNILDFTIFEYKEIRIKKANPIKNTETYISFRLQEIIDLEYWLKYSKSRELKRFQYKISNNIREVYLEKFCDKYVKIELCVLTNDVSTIEIKLEKEELEALEKVLEDFITEYHESKPPLYGARYIHNRCGIPDEYERMP